MALFSFAAKSQVSSGGLEPKDFEVLERLNNFNKYGKMTAPSCKPVGPEIDGLACIKISDQHLPRITASLTRKLPGSQLTEICGEVRARNPEDSLWLNQLVTQAIHRQNQIVKATRNSSDFNNKNKPFKFKFNSKGLLEFTGNKIKASTRL